MRLEALRWLHDVWAALVQLDADGTVIVASGPSGLDNARLRRAQVLATSNGVGIAIARGLLTSKLQGQVQVLTRLPENEAAIAVIEQALVEWSWSMLTRPPGYGRWRRRQRRPTGQRGHRWRYDLPGRM